MIPMAEIDILVNFDGVTTLHSKSLVLEKNRSENMAAIKVDDAQPSSGCNENYDVNKSHVEASNNIDAETMAMKRKKHRRRKPKKRKKKSANNNLSWEELANLDDFEGIKRRQPGTAQQYNVPVAPFNTTQFLIEDHNVQSPDYIKISQSLHRNHRYSDDEEENSSTSSDEGEEFLQKEFRVAYDEIHAERLEGMSKNDLIQEYIQLENRVDQLEHQLRGTRTRTRTESTSTVDNEMLFENEETVEKIRIFKEEITKLQQENIELKHQNAKLRTDSETDHDPVASLPQEVGGENQVVDSSSSEYEPTSSLKDLCVDPKIYGQDQPSTSRVGMDWSEATSGNVPVILDDESANDGFRAATSSSNDEMQCCEITSAGDGDQVKT